MFRGWGHDVYTPETKICPICGETMYEETKIIHDYSISTGKDYTVGTGEFYCPHCRDVAKQKAKEEAQKRFEDKCKTYDKGYQEYLDIREQDNVYTLQLTTNEIQALRMLVDRNENFQNYDLYNAYEILTKVYLKNGYRNTITQKQRNCINLIEKNTKHKFYGRTLESARKFISKYIDESRKV